MTTEPVVSASAVAGAIGALLVMLVSLGLLDLSQEQQTAIMAAVVAVLPIAAAVWARARVTPLVRPRDIDGATLTRPDNTPALPAQGQMMQEARSEMQGDFMARGLYK